jgi:hypothetical protein
MRVGGFVKLHRKLKQWGWYSDSNTMRVFLHLLLSANFEPSDFHGTRIEVGQAAFGRKEMAGALHLTEQQVRTALEHLQSTGEITIKGTNRFSVATLVKWQDYQHVEKENNQQNTTPITCQQPANHRADNQPITTSKKKEGKKEEKKQILPGGFDAFYAAYPRKVSPHDARKAWDKLTPDAALVEDIMSGLERFIAEHKASLASGKFTPEYPYPATWLNKRRWQDGAHRECPTQQKVDLSSLEVK